MTVAIDTVGYRVCSYKMKSSAWWKNGIKRVVEKKKAHKEMLQKNVSENFFSK